MLVRRIETSKKQKQFCLQGGFDTPFAANAHGYSTTGTAQHSNLPTPALSLSKGLNFQFPHREGLIKTFYVPGKTAQCIRLEVLCEEVLHFGVIMNRFGEDQLTAL